MFFFKPAQPKPPILQEALENPIIGKHLSDQINKLAPLEVRYCLGLNNKQLIQSLVFVAVLCYIVNPTFNALKLAAESIDNRCHPGDNISGDNIYCNALQPESFLHFMIIVFRYHLVPTNTGLAILRFLSRGLSIGILLMIELISRRQMIKQERDSPLYTEILDAIEACTSIKLGEPPYICPITHRIPNIPVSIICKDTGVKYSWVYDRDALMQWLSDSENPIIPQNNQAYCQTNHAFEYDDDAANKIREFVVLQLNQLKQSQNDRASSP